MVPLCRRSDSPPTFKLSIRPELRALRACGARLRSHQASIRASAFAAAMPRLEGKRACHVQLCLVGVDRFQMRCKDEFMDPVYIGGEAWLRE